MASQNTQSGAPGVTATEIDLSGPTPVGIVGVPAAIVGTAVKGPAYVPTTFASYDEFASIFGETDGERFGPLAVNEWMKNATAGTYLRVLGVGDGKARNDDGTVTNAGFMVGDEIVQSNGTVQPNPFSNEVTGLAGRTYFLGCFMSESNGSTIFSEAGIQSQPANVHAVREDMIVFTGQPGNNEALDITIPAGYGVDAGKTINVIFVNTLGSPGANQIHVKIAGSFQATVERLIKAINGTWGAGEASVHPAGATMCKYGPGFGSVRAIGGLQAIASGTDKITIRATIAGALANSIQFEDKAANMAFSPAGVTVNLTGGSDTGHAVPILRGVLLAPSGVILHLSGNNTPSSAAPGKLDTAIAAAGDLVGQKGSLTGSVDLASQEFVMLLNGHSGQNQVITASFDLNNNYFADVFNTDMEKIEQEGHCLYAHYDIHPNMAAVTGSGIIKPGLENGGKLDIAFMLTGSQGRGLASTGEHVDYEDFRDRFTHAESPFFISQSPAKDLFKCVALDSGESGRNQYKISIMNIKPAINDDSYGSFTLHIRKFDDDDREPKILESHRGVTLDPGSPNYIARVIGDQHTHFNFDADLESQKIVVDGTHPIRSRYIRIVLADGIKSLPKNLVPLGFRGPAHLNTSGSLLSGGSDTSYFIKNNVVNDVVEPPFPMRLRISTGTGPTVINSRLFWGMQADQIVKPEDPSLDAPFNESLNSHCGFYPSHRTTVTPFAIGNNVGATDLSGGTVLDCDRFNNNQFSLEKIRVVTGSDTRADPARWKSAVYVRQGIADDDLDPILKTRKFRITDLQAINNQKFAKFTAPMQGGFDGTNIFNRSKSRLENDAAHREMKDKIKQFGLQGPTVSAYRKAVDVLSEKSDSDIQLLAIPGIRVPEITNFAISAVEDRFDALYIMDIEEVNENGDVMTGSAPPPPEPQVNVKNTVNKFAGRGLDSSFAAAYFPDVMMIDPTTAASVQVPPSVAVLGAYSVNDKKGHPWTAPAGFTRGALSAVESAAVPLSTKNMDDLYNVDVNPLTSFSGTGVMVFGQKTLLQSSSALDRVNVRRLLIDIRRKVRSIANTLLFEPNRSETLERFSSLVNPILQSVQEKSGVDRYKVIIDSTTTTQADIENNTIRGKIFLQPTRAVEFVALDFVVTNAGNVFENI